MASARPATRQALKRNDEMIGPFNQTLAMDSSNQGPATSDEGISVEDQTGNLTETEREDSATSELNPNILGTEDKDLLMIEVLTKLSRRLNNDRPSSRNFKVNEPEPFTGRNRFNLQLFIRQCESVFRAKRGDFSESEDKVSYAGTYLVDLAQHWYTRQIAANSECLNDWLDFIKELEENFGDVNKEVTAEKRLRNLRMRSGEECVEFITKFKDIIEPLNWNDEPLMSAFKRGLPDRILSELMRRERDPENLEELMKSSLDIDKRYWEFQAIQQERSRPSGSTFNHSQQPSRPAFKPNQSPRSWTRPSNQNIKPVKKPFNKPSFLTSDYKLTTDEKERRTKQGLCLYCAKPGHVVAECPLRQSRNVTLTRASTSRHKVEDKDDWDVSTRDKGKNANADKW